MDKLLMPMEDGTPGYRVLVSAIPARYWREHSRAWQMGYKANTDVHGTKMGKTPGTLSSIDDGGDIRFADVSGTYGSYYAWIPASYFDPESNEYGECAL